MQNNNKENSTKTNINWDIGIYGNTYSNSYE